jgi:hypothetical protein
MSANVVEAVVRAGVAAHRVAVVAILAAIGLEDAVAAA